MNTHTADLDYLRDLAEAGQTSALLGGRFLAWWGTLTALTYALHFAVLTGYAPLPQAALGAIWSGFALIGGAGSFIIRRTFPIDKPGAGSVGNRIQTAVWRAGLFVLFAFFAGAILASILQRAPSAGFDWSVPLVFAVYGIAQVVSGQIAEQKMLQRLGFLSIAVVGFAVLLIGTPWLYALAALAAAITSALPGFMLMRGEPARVV